jgi:hypothetical protein
MATEDTYQGLFTSNDKGQCVVFNKSEFNQFFKDNPNSRFEVTITKVNAKYKKYLIIHYQKVVLPACMKGFRELGYNIFEPEVEIELKKISPTMTRKGNTADISDPDFSAHDLKNFIFDCTKFAAEHLYVVIEEPE